MKKSLLTLLFISLILCCSQENYEKHDKELPVTELGKAILKEGEKIRLIVSTNIIGDIVSNIAGSKAELISLIKPGLDPHNYEPSPKDLVQIEKAHLIFVNGFGLEEGLLKLLNNASKAPVIEVSSKITPLKGSYDHHEEHHEGEDHNEEHHEGEDHNEEHHEGEDHHDHENDPHTWTSPRNILKWIETIEEALVSVDPTNAAYYKSQAKSYFQKIQALDSYIIEKIKQISEDKRTLICDHKVMEYFAKDYGFKTPTAVSLSFSSNSEPSAKDLANLVEIINKSGVSAIFLSASSGEALANLTQIVSKESKKTVKVIEILAGSLSEAGGKAPNYIEYMKYNAAQIIKGLAL